MKKFLSLSLATVFLLATCFPVFADANESSFSNSHDDFDLDLNDYIQYTIDLSSEKSSNYISASSEGKNVPANSIDKAIDYVSSLELDDKGYSHILEVCIDELNFYKDEDVILEKYTVLVPSANSMQYFGTHSGYDFYCQYVSISNMRRETKGAEKKSSNADVWNGWITGVLDLVLTFISDNWVMPYSLIRSAIGLSVTSSDVHYGSYNEYVEQFSNTVTRVIYKQRGSNYIRCYQDQSSYLRVNHYFCPVGTVFPSDYYNIGQTFAGTVNANQLTTSQILNMANVYSNHGGEAIFRVTDHHITERME